MSEFRNAWAGMEDALDAGFGETLIVVPMIDGDFSAGVDPGNPPFEAVGILTEPDKIAQPRGRTGADKSDPVIADPSVDFAESAFGPGRPRPVKGFELVAVERRGRPRYRVTEDVSDGLVRAVFRLVLIGS